MRKILIIGGSNCIGPYIIKGLLENNCDITVITRGNKPVPFANDLKHIKTDAGIDKDLTEKLGISFYDAVIDSVSRDSFFVENVLSQVETARYVQISTIGVYGYSDLPISEDKYKPEEYDLHSFYSARNKGYGEKKRSAEAAAYQKFRNTNPVSIRPAYVTDILHPFHDQNIRLWELVHWIKNEIPINSSMNDYVCSFTLAHEEAELVLKLLDCVYVGPVNVSNKDSITIGEILSIIESLVGKKAEFHKNGMMPEFNGRKKMDLSLYSEVLQKEPTEIRLWIENLIKEYIESDYIFESSWIDLFHKMCD